MWIEQRGGGSSCASCLRVPRWCQRVAQHPTPSIARLPTHLTTLRPRSPRRALRLCLRPQIAFTVTTSEPLQQIQVWLYYHRTIGVRTFYLFVDGQVRESPHAVSLHAWVAWDEWGLWRVRGA